VSGRLDPDVRPPYFDVARRPDQVADKPAVAEGRRAGCVPRAPRPYELLPSRGRLLELLAQERLGLALACVSRREQPAGVLQVLVREGNDLQPGHRHRFAETARVANEVEIYAHAGLDDRRLFARLELPSDLAADWWRFAGPCRQEGRAPLRATTIDA
jgi:hypothetical protein